MKIQFTFPEFFKGYKADQEIPEEFKNLDIDELATKQQTIEHDLNRWRAFRAYGSVVFYLCTIVWTMILWGYEIQAGSMVLSIPQFRKDFGYYYEGEYVLSAKWQSAITAAPTAALAVGGIIGSWTADRIGRRRVLIIATLFGIPFITMEYIAVTIEVFFVGKFINGFAQGAISAVCSAYLSELSPLALRGIFSSALNMSACVSAFVCVLINNTTAEYTTRMAYRAIFIPQWVFSATALAMQFFLPESPYWLLQKNRHNDAIINLRRMFNEGETLKGQYALMKVTVDEEATISAKGGGYADCFKAKDFKRTFIVVFTYSMQIFCGLPYATGYSTYYYQLAGFNTYKSFQVACGAQALSVSGTLLAFFTVDRFGRRSLLLVGMTAMTVLNLIVAVTGMFTSNKAAVETSVGFMAMYNFVYNMGIGTGTMVVGVEVASVFLRAKTISLGNFAQAAFQCLWMSVLPYMFNPDEANMGSKINFIFTGCSFLSIFVFFFYLPETAHRSFEEIDEMYGANVPPRRWASYVTKHHMETHIDEAVELDFADNPKREEEFIESTSGSASSNKN